MHHIVKSMGYKSEEAFYKDFPTEESYHRHMADGGYIDNGVLPQIMPGMYPGNAPVLMNQDAKIPVRVDVPAYANGGFYQRPGYYYNGNSMVKTKGATYNNGDFFQQGGYPHPLDIPFDNFKMGGYPHPLDMLFDEFKKGGWIQGAINPKHKGYCTPMTKSTCTPHRKALAKRFKSGDLHKKDGGYIDTANPYHPIHQYMADGGQVDVNGNPIGAWGMNPNPNSQETMQDVQAPVQQANQDLVMMDDYNHQQAQKQAVSPQSPTDAPSTQVSMDNGQYTDQSTDDTVGAPKHRRNGFANWGSAILGVGTGILGAASIYHDKFHNQKNQQMWQRQQGMSDNLPRMNSAFSHGTTDQYGNMPYNNFSQSPNIRTMEKGGYTKGQEVELSDSEIAAMIKKGYKLQRI